MYTGVLAVIQYVHQGGDLVAGPQQGAVVTGQAYSQRNVRKRRIVDVLNNLAFQPRPVKKKHITAMDGVADFCKSSHYLIFSDMYFGSIHGEQIHWF